MAKAKRKDDAGTTHVAAIAMLKRVFADRKDGQISPEAAALRDANRAFKSLQKGAFRFPEKLPLRPRN